MFYQVISQCTQTLKNFEACLDKAEQHAAAKKFDVGVLMTSRLAPLSWAPGKVIGGVDYLLQMTLPNTYFHISMAYAILRHNGVDVGKMDYLGSINLVDA